jgi:hypothetical protein
LRPAASRDYTWPNTPANQEDALYFEFELTKPSVTTQYQLVLHKGKEPYSPLTTAPIDAWDDYLEKSQSIYGRALPLPAKGPTRYMLVVDRQGSLVAETMTLLYKNNLSFIHPKKLICVERNDSYPDQTDEIFQYFEVDGTGKPTFMAESPPYLPYSKVGEFDNGTDSATHFSKSVGLIRYLDHEVPNLTEEDDDINGSNDYFLIANSPLIEHVFVPEALLYSKRLMPLNPNARAIDSAKLIWEDEPGSNPDYRYKMYFRLSH